MFEITSKSLEDIIRNECISNFSGWSKSLKKAYFYWSFPDNICDSSCGDGLPLQYTHILLRLRDKARSSERTQLLEMGGMQRVSSGNRRLYLIGLYLQQASSNTLIRVNLSQGVDRKYLSRAQEKTTNLSLTVVAIFIITNLPYMVDEWIRQEILSNSWCSMSWCRVVEANIGISMVSN